MKQEQIHTNTFGLLILRKIIKIVASSAGGAYCALAGFNGHTSKGRRGEEGKKG